MYSTSFIATYGRPEVSADSEKYVKLFISDSPLDKSLPPNIWFVSLDIDNNYEFMYDSLDLLSYDAFVENHRLFVNEDTRLLKMKMVDIREKIEDTKDKVIFRIIVMTDNTALYEMELKFVIP